mgnify:CR=1 FL=1
MKTYDIFFTERASIKEHIQKFLLYPNNWQNEDYELPQNLEWNAKKFSPQNLKKIPKNEGVYAFVLIPEINSFFQTKYLFYIGKTSRDLRTRYNEYLNEKNAKGKSRVKIYDMLNMYEGHLYFFYSVIHDKHKINECEDKLLNMFMPHVNVQIPEAKVRPVLSYIYE